MPRATLCAALGTAVWLLLAVVPGRDGSNVSGGPYVWALAACAVLVGATLDGYPLVNGALLAAPALLTAAWLAPRGDEDGLWMLWFVVVVLAAGVAAAAHGAAVAGLRRLRARGRRS